MILLHPVTALKWELFLECVAFMRNFNVNVINEDASVSGQSAKKKMAQLGFMILDESYYLIKTVKEYGEASAPKRRDIIGHSITVFRRVLGYVKESTNSTDEHGWALLLAVPQIKEYLSIIQVTGGVAPATVANYAHKMHNLYAWAIDVFFVKAGMPVDPTEVSK